MTRDLGFGPSTVTLLFTDLVGSIELGDRLGDKRADQLRREHFKMLRKEVLKHRGREVKTTGDGMMAAFGSAVDAVDSAVAIQRQVTDASRKDGPNLEVRVGLNAGDAINEDDDYFGTAVTVAARLCAAAQGGQIIASDLVRGLAGSRGDQQFIELGPLDLMDSVFPRWSGSPRFDFGLSAGIDDLPDRPLDLAFSLATDFLDLAHRLLTLAARFQVAVASSSAGRLL